ncbi:MAG: Fic family protein [bacterium]|nr:Fic family protein [bacterium]
MDINKDIISKYPWLAFEVNLNALPSLTWVQIGECLSKCEHLSRIPLKPAIAEEMHKVYLAKGASATTAIEGNTLSEGQVRQIIDNKLEVPPSREYLKQEVENILFLCNELKDTICNGKKFVVSKEEIKRFNKIILQNVPCPDYAIPGEFRSVPVVAGVYKAVDSQDVDFLMDKMCIWLNSDYFIIPDAHPIANSIIKAIVAHLYLEWVHPFGDGNGRVGRLLEFAILIASGVPSPAAHLLSNHYNLTRSEYYRQLSVATQKRNICEFITYAIQGFRDGLAEQLQYIFKQVLEISWESYVYDKFKEHKRSETPSKRMRALVIELADKNEPVPKEGLVALSPKIVDYYKQGSSKMLSRDLNELMHLDLIVQTDKGYRAKTENLLALLPARAVLDNIT